MKNIMVANYPHDQDGFKVLIQAQKHLPTQTNPGQLPPLHPAQPPQLPHPFRLAKSSLTPQTAKSTFQQGQQAAQTGKF